MRGRDLLNKLAGNRLVVLSRYREIVSVLISYGLDELFSHDLLPGEEPSGFRLGAFFQRDSAGENRWERVRLALEELGPTFVKLGQILSNRPDLLPAELIEELELLQENARPLSEKVIETTLLEQFNAPIDIVFEEFNRIPLASASIGQVHRATLKCGADVVVKILRPGINKTIASDLDIMRQLAMLAVRYNSSIARFNPVALIEEFRKTIMKEVNFLNEASHIQRFAQHFQDTKTIVVPRLYHDYTSHSVLVMEYIEGYRPSEISRLKNEGFDLKKIATDGTGLILQQVFINGFFHADPHPGNIRILKDGRICFLDFGMMGSILPTWKRALGQGMIALSNKDYERLTDGLIFLTGCKDRDIRMALMVDVQELVDKYSYMNLKHIDVVEFSGELYSMIKKYQLTLPYSLYLLIKAVGTIEGIARGLDPDFNLMKQLKPYARKLITQQLSPKQAIENAFMNSYDMVSFLSDIPMETKDFIRKVKEGQIQIQFMHKGLEDISVRIDRTGQKLAYAIVMAALIAGAAMVTVAKVPPLWHDVSLFGVAGMVIALFLGLRIVMKR
ncbi:MAG: AarF/UbiB family protein [Fibrobacterales bacterium]